MNCFLSEVFSVCERESPQLIILVLYWKNELCLSTYFSPSFKYFEKPQQQVTRFFCLFDHLLLFFHFVLFREIFLLTFFFKYHLRRNNSKKKKVIIKRYFKIIIFSSHKWIYETVRVDLVRKAFIFNNRVIFITRHETL